MRAKPRQCLPAKSEVASDTFAETCDSLAPMIKASHHQSAVDTAFCRRSPRHVLDCGGRAKRDTAFSPLRPFYPLIYWSRRPTIERSSSPRPIHPPESMIQWPSMHDLQDRAKIAFGAKSEAASDTFATTCDLMTRMSKGFLAPRRTFERNSAPRQILFLKTVIHCRA